MLYISWYIVLNNAYFNSIDSSCIELCSDVHSVCFIARCMYGKGSAFFD